MGTFGQYDLVGKCFTTGGLLAPGDDDGKQFTIYNLYGQAEKALNRVYLIII